MLSILQNEPYGAYKHSWDEQYIIQFQEICKDLIKLNERSSGAIKELFNIKLSLSVLARSFEGSNEAGNYFTSISKLTILI